MSKKLIQSSSATIALAMDTQPSTVSIRKVYLSAPIAVGTIGFVNAKKKAMNPSVITAYKEISITNLRYKLTTQRLIKENVCLTKRSTILYPNGMMIRMLIFIINIILMQRFIQIYPKDMNNTVCYPITVNDSTLIKLSTQIYPKSKIISISHSILIKSNISYIKYIENYPKYIITRISNLIIIMLMQYRQPLIDKENNNIFICIITLVMVFLSCVKYYINKLKWKQ
jgi:hypothetical protein